MLKKVMNSFWRGRLRLFRLICPRVEIQNRANPNRRAYLFEDRDGDIWRTRDIDSPDSRWELAPKRTKNDGPFEYIEFDDTPGWQQVADREKVIHDPAFVLLAIQQTTEAVPRDMGPNEHTWRYIHNLDPLPAQIVDLFSDSYCERVDLVRWCEEEDFEIPKSWRRSPDSSVDESGAQPSDHPSDRQASAHNQALAPNATREPEGGGARRATSGVGRWDLQAPG